MDLILTPLVTRLLKQYVKRSSEGVGRDLKVRRAFSGGRAGGWWGTAAQGCSSHSACRCACH